MNLKKFYFSLLFVFFAFSINAEELKNNNQAMHLMFIQACLILVMMVRAQR